MDEALRQATLGATSAQAPASPLGSFPELSKLYESSFQGLQSAAPTAARVNLASDTVSRQNAAKKKSNYQKVKRDDGGFGFYDGEGNEMSAYEYAIATGKKPSDILTDSENPIDIGYLSDYKNLQKFLSHYQNKDYSEKDKIEVENTVREQPELKRFVDSNDLTGLIDRFKQAYPTVYGGNKAGVPVGRTFIPRAETGSEEDPADPGSNRISG